MPTKSTNTQKIKALTNLYNIIEIILTRDDAEPLVYKGKLIRGFKFSNIQILTNLDSTGKVSENVLDLKPDTGSSNDVRLDRDREFDREIQLNRKYVEMVRLAIRIRETYPDCSEPPMSNPSPKIGLLELKAWAMKELKKAQGLKTLGDYRRAAKDPNFEDSLFPKGKNVSIKDAIKIALEHDRRIIECASANIPEKNWWSVDDNGVNVKVFSCVVLMEFYIIYKDEHSTDDFFPGWPKPCEKEIFNFLCQDGGAIINVLRQSYKKYSKDRTPTFREILNGTPAVNDLQIKPEPNIIIKTWLSKIIKSIQEKGVSPLIIEEKFNSLNRQLESEKDGQGETESKEQTEKTNDAWIKVTEAASLAGVNPGTITRWANNGDIQDNGKRGKERKVLKSSVLLKKAKREDDDRRKDTDEVLKDIANNIPDKH